MDSPVWRTAPGSSFQSAGAFSGKIWWQGSPSPWGTSIGKVLIRMVLCDERKCPMLGEVNQDTSIHRLRIVTDMHDTSILTRAQVHSCVDVPVSTQGKGGREAD